MVLQEVRHHQAVQVAVVEEMLLEVLVVLELQGKEMLVVLVLRIVQLMQMVAVEVVLVQ